MRSYTVKFCHVLNSVVVAIIPLLGHFDDINFYRFVLPGVFIPLAIITMLLAGRIKERIPQPPIEKKQPIPFWYGVTQVMRNKYHWLNMSSSVIDALGNGMLNMQTIIFLYTLRLSGLEYSLLGVLFATRTTLPTFFAPHFLKKYSFRTLKIFKQIVNITTIGISILALLFLQNQLLACGIILFLMSYLGSFLTQVTRIAEVDMDVRLRDYQMYLSGERIENFSNVFGWFSSPIITLIGLAIPLLLLTNGFNSNWDVLFLDSARFNILAIPMIIDLVGHIIMIIPFSFWDYDNTKHKYVIDVLIQREKLANEGYFPQTYEGGLDFEKPASCKGSIPVNIGEKEAAKIEGADKP